MSRWLTGEPVWTGGRKRGVKQFRFQNGGQFQFGPNDNCIVIVIPSTFVFDLSIPWWAAWLIPAAVKRKMLRAAGLHDRGRGDPGWSLWFGDLAFMDACHADDLRDPWLTICWRAVQTNNKRT